MEYVRKNKTLLLILIILVIIIVYLANKKPEIIYEEPNIELLEPVVIEQIEPVAEIKSVIVDIKGEVKNPGVYELLETNRVIDVINLSGGLLEDADTSKINLSKKLKDEMVIIIAKKQSTIKIECNCPTLENSNSDENCKTEETKKDEEVKDDEETKKDEEVKNNDEKIPDETLSGKNENIQNDTNIEADLNNKNEDSNVDKIQNDASIEIDSNDKIGDDEENIQNDASIEIEQNDKTEESNSENMKISLNTATKEELMTLSGIGESKALAIIEYRNNNLFESIEEITNVKGIGQSIYEKIKENITI